MAPHYLQLYESGKLEQRIEIALKRMECCTICPLECKVNRLGETLGVCGVGEFAPVASYAPHFGEEPPLVGKNGSGTIFFGSCNLRCLFCQNYDISHLGMEYGHHNTSEELADIMIFLQQQGCHNINFVTPTHVVPQILKALPFAIKKGLSIPLVYNSSGYESAETLELLEGVIDIYMPDFKFWYNSTGKQLTNADNYGDIAREAIRIMFKQVGNLIFDDSGCAQKGLLVRHLVMPDQLSETEKILNYLAETAPGCYVNIMDQYRPCGKACKPIDRPLTGNEYQQALQYAHQTGLNQLNENGLLELLNKLGIAR